jgi:hypothetical protein
MEETLIEFETAKLAKEKGYSYNNKYFFSKEGNPYTNYSKDTLDCYDRPSQSVLQKWLRDNHKMNVDLHTVWTAEGEFVYHVTLIFFKDGIVNHKPIYSETPIDELFPRIFQTYELALEAGLLEALKQI